MKINKVKLYNFSSYEGNNEFDFEITDAEKNIVLIGGKNGAGKTSLFTAIKVALYGPLAYGYVGVNSHYISKIKDLINSKAFQQEIVESEVQITLQLKIERDIRNYVITRKWDYTNQRLTEEYTVERDGKAYAITQYYNIIQGNLKSSQVFIRATEFNSDVRKVQKAKLAIPDEQILLNDPIPQRREIREIYEKIYTRISKVAEAEKEKANRLLEQIGMYLDYEDIDDEDIEDLIDKIKLFYEIASSSLVNIHGNIQVLDGIKKDAKTISVAFSEVKKGIASTDDLDTLLMFSKDPLAKIERIVLKYMMKHFRTS